MSSSNKRLLAEVFFLILYVLIVYFRIIVNPFDLVSDFKSYHDSYVLNNDLFSFGVEFITPLFFSFFRFFDLDFYDFSFLYSVFYLIPIIMLSRRVSLLFLPLFFLFFLVWFVPNNVFLLRQYISFAFLIMAFLTREGRRISGLLLLLSFFSHVSALLFYLVSFLKIKRRSAYILMALISVLSFFIQIRYLYLADYVERLLAAFADIDFGQNINRKIYGQLVSAREIDVVGSEISILNFSVMSLAVVFHSFKIFKHGEKSNLMKLFYFSSIFSLMFAGITVLSNRVGFVGYFFSLPYLFLVLSCFRINKDIKIKVYPMTLGRKGF